MKHKTTKRRVKSVDTELIALRAVATHMKKFGWNMVVSWIKSVEATPRKNQYRLIIEFVGPLPKVTPKK